MPWQTMSSTWIGPSYRYCHGGALDAGSSNEYVQGEQMACTLVEVVWPWEKQTGYGNEVIAQQSRQSKARQGTANKNKTVISPETLCDPRSNCTQSLQTTVDYSPYHDGIGTQMGWWSFFALQRACQPRHISNYTVDPVSFASKWSFLRKSR